MSAPPFTKPSKADVRESTSPPRLRSVLLVSLGTVVALTLGAAVAIELWYHAQPLDDAAVHDQPSLQALAGQALIEARDIGAFVRHSASRDVSRVVSLVLGAEGKAAVADAKDMRAQTPTRPVHSATVEPSPRGSRSGGPSHNKEPIPTTAIAPPPTIPGSISSAALKVFDHSDVGVTPPLMHRVRLRSAFRASPHSQPMTERTGLVEIVVSISGIVESAKFVTRPFDVHEAMLLSAVKTWRFRPAMRDGHAIRYRLRIPISRVRV